MTGEGTTLRLRPAGPQDLDLLRHWDAQPHVMEIAGEPEESDWDWENQLGRFVPWREMLIAEHAGAPIGFMQIIDPAEEDTQYWGVCPPGLRAIDIWIGEARNIRKGYGRQMMKLAIRRCFAAPGVTAILIDPLASNLAAHRFYEAVGFSCVGPRRFGSDDCLVYRLDRKDWRQGD